MTFLDFIVFFIYVFIFNAIFSAVRKKNADPQLRIYHRNAFWIKVFSCFVYSLFVLYISRGDTSALYFPEGYNFYRLILKDPSNVSLLWSSAADFNEELLSSPDALGYLKDDSNYMVTVITAAICFLTAGKYMAVNLFFSMMSFTGVWRLYLFFHKQFPQLHKQIAIAILYLPTFIFWSSGILKDPLCVGALGWLTYALYSSFYIRKESLIKNVFIVMVSGYLLYVLKVYILVSYLPAFSLFLILKNVTLIKNKLVKALMIITFLIGSALSFVKIASSLQLALGGFASEGLTQSIAQYQANYGNQELMGGSYFSLGVEFDGSASSLLRIAPAAITATLFRPYLWESKKISTLLSSIESLMLMLFTIYTLGKVGIKNFCITIVNKPIVLYCFIFSIIFALFVGATTLNFGSLVRYKIPSIPFYILSLFFILFYNKKIKLSPLTEQA